VEDDDDDDAVYVSLLKNSVPKQRVSTTNINMLVLFKEIIAAYSENHMIPINILYNQTSKSCDS
jgi:hypothetical protein